MESWRGLGTGHTKNKTGKYEHEWQGTPATKEGMELKPKSQLREFATMGANASHKGRNKLGGLTNAKAIEADACCGGERRVGAAAVDWAQPCETKENTTQWMNSLWEALTKEPAGPFTISACRIGKRPEKK